MNQILIHEKIYVTPELKRKKKIFRYEFFLSVFLLCLLSSYAIYAEYDRNRNEAVSKELLGSINYGTSEKRTKLLNNNSNVARVEDDVIVVILNQALRENEEIGFEEEYVQVVPEQEELVSELGSKYSVIGEIKIPSIDINYPIILPDNMENIDELLKISVCKFHGADPNEVGNLCIVGHNYRNSKFFSKIQYLEKDDIIEVKDLSGRTIEYKIYKQFVVDPDDVACTSQLTGGRREITLITCTDDNKQRFIVKAKQV